MLWRTLARFTYLVPCTSLLLACGDDNTPQSTATESTTQTPQTTGDDPSTSTATTPGTTVDPTIDGTTGPLPTTGPGPTTGPEPTTGPTTGPGEETDTMEEPVCPYTPSDGASGFALQEVASGFDRPVLALPDPRDSTRLFVVEQGGHVRILEAGETVAPDDDFLFVEVENANSQEIGPEQGLLGFAFHPNFPDDPRVYINYNPNQQGPGPTWVSEFKLDPNDPDKVDPNSERLVIAIGQPAANHNGGMIAFGSDGYLYIGMGDGGGANDTFNTGRDPLSLHAKILRIDVEPDGQADSNKACDDCPMVDGFDYTVPADNPHVGDDAYAPEVWAMGFRNPWRFVFDPKTDVLYSADVGQGVWEEVAVVEKGSDHGWSLMEGNHCFGQGGCDTSAGPNQVNEQGFTAPIEEYSHDEGGCSVTGGAVYYGCEVPNWHGIYFYADYCSGNVWGLRWDGTNVEDLGVVTQTDDERVLGFGWSGFGDALFTTVVTEGQNQIVDGKIWRIVPQ